MPASPVLTRKRAFISHSSPDDRYVAEFVQLVRSFGFDEVFNDSHSIEPDERFWERIEQGIRECEAFVVILSKASVKSYWVDREVIFAREHGKRVIPIRIDDCNLPASFDGRDVIELKHQGKAQRLSPPRFIHHSAEHFLGREPQLALLDEAWTSGTNVLSIIAWGGVGKTALITEWVQTRFIEHGWQRPRSGTFQVPSATGDLESPPHWLDAYFDWTFYDQGTRALADGTEARTGSVGDFFEQALVFFGDPDPNLPGKGRRLAEKIREAGRTLLILDGLEPLQQPPGHPQAGRLLDPDLRDLLAALAQSNPGLCLITSRQALTDLHALRRTVHTEHELEDLPVAIAIRLLRELQIKGTDLELAEASEKFGCHALSLTLLGRYLSDAHGGDIARTDRIRDLQRADTLTREDRHRTAWRILETYESWLATAQADGNPKTLAVLRLTGLFDRTATADCLAALRADPIIPGLTNAICGMAEDEWNILLKRLERAHLIKLRDQSNRKATSSDSAWSIDAHPLIRQYFAKQLKQDQPEAFKAAHSRLFEYLCANAPESTRTEHLADGWAVQELLDRAHCGDSKAVSLLSRLLSTWAGTFEQKLMSLLNSVGLGANHPPEILPSLAELSQLYQAVEHGCLAGCHEDACRNVYVARILRGARSKGFYSTKTLGAIGPDLAALAAFFEQPWSGLSPSLSDDTKAWLLNEVATRLTSLGRLRESFSLLQTSLELCRRQKDWGQLSIRLSNLSEQEVVMGRIQEAVADGNRAIEMADRSKNTFHSISKRTIVAAALYDSGKTDEAFRLFEEAERLQSKRQLGYKLLYAGQGYRFCNLIIAPAERAAWLRVVDVGGVSNAPILAQGLSSSDPEDRTCAPLFDRAISALAEVERRAKKTLEWFETKYPLVDSALDYHTLARAFIYRSILCSESVRNSHSHWLAGALSRFEQSGQIIYLPLVLLTAAFYHGTLGENLEEAERLLEEAQQIAERGPMPLYLADVHLHRARLFGRMNADERKLRFSDIDTKAELREARRLIEKHGYWRRKEELEDAEAAAATW